MGKGKRDMVLVRYCRLPLNKNALFSAVYLVYFYSVSHSKVTTMPSSGEISIGLKKGKGKGGERKGKESLFRLPL